MRGREANQLNIHFIGRQVGRKTKIGTKFLGDGDELIDVMKRGQGVLNVLAIGGLKEGLDQQLVQLSTDSTSPAAAAV